MGICDSLWKEPNQGKPYFCAPTNPIEEDNQVQKNELHDPYISNQIKNNNNISPKKPKILRYTPTYQKQGSIMKTTLVELREGNSLLNTNKYSKLNEMNNSMNAYDNNAQINNEDEEVKIQEQEGEEDSSSEQVEIMSDGEFTEDYIKSNGNKTALMNKELEKRGDYYVKNFEENMRKKNELNNQPKNDKNNRINKNAFNDVKKKNNQNNKENYQNKGFYNNNYVNNNKINNKNLKSSNINSKNYNNVSNKKYNNIPSSNSEIVKVDSYKSTHNSTGNNISNI